MFRQVVNFKKLNPDVGAAAGFGANGTGPPNACEPGGSGWCSLVPSNCHMRVHAVRSSCVFAQAVPVGVLAPAPPWPCEGGPSCTHSLPLSSPVPPSSTAAAADAIDLARGARATTISDVYASDLSAPMGAAGIGPGVAAGFHNDASSAPPHMARSGRA